MDDISIDLSISDFYKDDDLYDNIQMYVNEDNIQYYKIQAEKGNSVAQCMLGMYYRKIEQYEPMKEIFFNGN
jgi:hypothetical protein